MFDALSHARWDIPPKIAAAGEPSISKHAIAGVLESERLASRVFVH